MKSCSLFCRSFFTVRSALGFLALSFACGCAADSGSPEQTPEQKQAAIQSDPMGYKQVADPRSLDGGVTNTNNFGRDFHDFFEP